MLNFPIETLFRIVPLLIAAVAILIGLVAIRLKGPLTRVFQLTDEPEAKLIATHDTQDIRKIERELRANPGDLGVADKLVRACVASGDKNKLDRAREILRRGEPSWADTANYCSLLAWVYMQMETPTEDPLVAIRLARQAAENAVKLDPAHPKRWILLGYIHWKLGENAKAIEVTQEGLRLLNNWVGEEREKLQAAGWGNLAYYYALGALREKSEEAIDLAEKALSLFQNAHTLDTLAFVLIKFRSGDSDALEAADQALGQALGYEDAPRLTIEGHLRKLREMKRTLARAEEGKASRRSS